MEALLHELDRGDQSLPVGSELIFLNTHNVDSTVGPAADRVRINCIHVTHIQVSARARFYLLHYSAVTLRVHGSRVNDSAVSVYVPIRQIPLPSTNHSALQLRAGAQGNPLAAESFETLVDISEYSCAMCLCDRLWVDPDADSSNGVDFMEERDMLRLDSMLLLVQLHIRYALQAKARALRLPMRRTAYSKPLRRPQNHPLMNPAFAIVHLSC